MERLLPDWFISDATEVAPRLLGKIVQYGECSGRIVETEAYTTDPASHGRVITPRSAIMRDTFGHWYVYFTYGMHYCANVTTNHDGIGAVLIRAVEPLEGIALMEERRGMKDIRKLCSGPAKFTQAFCITKHENGLSVAGDLAILDAPPVPPEDVAASPRIGIKAGADLPWRFFIRGNPRVSRPS
ncbi:MAG TPA: DNA-3-methyladenine glycosylase [Candidatus Paceibacterota bacterium]|nr:DNA-3-methyladenine glycosylase [Candidatus Paceibacterota bacterium]